MDGHGCDDCDAGRHTWAGKPFSHRDYATAEGRRVRLYGWRCMCAGHILWCRATYVTAQFLGARPPCHARHATTEAQADTTAATDTLIFTGRHARP
jgi:hypothetical protein